MPSIDSDATEIWSSESLYFSYYLFIYLIFATYFTDEWFYLLFALQKIRQNNKQINLRC